MTLATTEVDAHLVEADDGRAEPARVWPSVARVVGEARPYRDRFPLPWPAGQDALAPR